MLVSLPSVPRLPRVLAARYAVHCGNARMLLAVALQLSHGRDAASRDRAREVFAGARRAAMLATCYRRMLASEVGSVDAAAACMLARIFPTGGMNAA